MYRILLMLLLSVFMIGCVSTKEVETKNHTYTLKGKEVRGFNKSEKAYNLSPQGSRVFSLHKFPTKDSVSVDIRYLEGKTDTLVEVVTEYDTITNTETKFVYKYLHRVDTLIKDSIVSITDTREIDALVVENGKCKIEKDKLEGQSKDRLIAIVILSVILGLSIFFHFKR